MSQAKNGARIVSIDTAELQALMNRERKPLLIDVRTPAEFESVRIPGSYNVPLPMLAEHREELAHKFQDDLVLICGSGTRATEACQHLQGVGIETASVLKGGILQFESIGGEVVRGAARWAMERQVRMAAGVLVLLGFVGGKLISPKLGYLTGAIGAGLTFSAATNSCAMASVLAKMPWNRAAPDPQAEKAIASIPVALQND